MTHCEPPIPATISDSGGKWPGFVLGWVGRRCYVTYNSGIGLQHLTWVPAERVQRSDLA